MEVLHKNPAGFQTMFDNLYCYFCFYALGTFTSQSSVHAPPGNVTINSAEADGQMAGPSRVNPRNISAVEKLQRAFARESVQFRRGRGVRHNRFENESSDVNHSTESSDSTSDEEDRPTSTLEPQRASANEAHSIYRASQDLEGAVQSGARAKLSARHVNAEVHVVPLDDKSVGNGTEIEESNGLDCQNDQKNNLSEPNARKHEDSHVVEIHTEQPERSVNLGDRDGIDVSAPSREYTGTLTWVETRVADHSLF